jgi:hypothetical protein
MLAARRLVRVSGAQTDRGVTLRGFGAASGRDDSEPVAVEDEQRRHIICRTGYRDQPCTCLESAGELGEGEPFGEEDATAGVVGYEVEQLLKLGAAAPAAAATASPSAG